MQGICQIGCATIFGSFYHDRNHLRLPEPSLADYDAYILKRRQEKNDNE